MNEFGALLDGGVFLANSPFRSAYFLVISIVGCGIVAVNTYIICRHWNTLPLSVIVVLGVFISVHTVYQWWRALRYYSKIRALYGEVNSQEVKSMAPHEAALRIAAGGIADILFYSFGMTLITLGIIASTLTHLDGIR